MKKLDYYWPRAALQITGIVFASQTLMEVSGVATRKAGFEWVYPACGVAFAAACIWTVVVVLLNAKRR